MENTLEEPLLDQHPYVHGDFGLRFYAAVPLITPDNYIIGTFCVLDTKPRAITEHERQILRNLGKVVMEQTERRLSILLEDEFKAQLLRQQDEFISLASHELKTPVTSLKAAVQLIDRLKENYPQDTTLSKMVGQADRSLNKLVVLVNNLLDVGRIATGRLPMHKKTFRLKQLVSRCCGNLTANTSNQGLSYNGPSELDVYADEERIEQVIGNLLNNASKYNSGPGKILISAIQHEGNIKISVADNGPGIPPDKISVLFDRYNSLEESGVKLSGLGLSLYISAGIIHAHGGEIGVESKHGQGATFWFTLPDDANKA